MRWRRVVVVLAVAVVALVAGVQMWIAGHTVDLVVVNTSGTPVEVAWQPAPGAATTSEIEPGCSSVSLPISRGSSWRVSRDSSVILESSSAALPMFDPLVAVEVWLSVDGSIRIVPPHAVDRPIDAPYPSCIPSP
ncbi:MAG TPA: hypothetical protein VF494_05375 [Candidatus Limnocylindrales bacterium]